MVAAAAAALLTSCSKATPSVIDARGPLEHRVTNLWWLMLVLSALVFALVVGMIGGGLVRSRRRTEDEARAEVRWGERFIVGVGVIGAAVVLVTVFALSIREMRAMADQGHRSSLTLRVTSHDWWWEARYPNGAVTANEIHIPAGRAVRLRLLTADVIHSFWVPQLAPKTDLVPGKTNDMWIEASEPGRFRGECAEYCGLQHANMAFEVVADTPSAFGRWVRAQARPAVGSASSEGARLFLSSTCAGCHRVRGTPADAGDGPDLTHVASRRFIASGTLRNTRDEMRDWLTDPQGEKPGTVMPPSPLNAAQIDALVAYMESLK